MYKSIILTAFTLISSTVAQTTTSTFTDDNGITFWDSAWDTTIGDGDATFGMALPPATETSLVDEYIGRLVIPIPSSGTWFGVSHASMMTGALLLIVWPNGEDVVTDLRYATGYVAPEEYTGNATVTTISSSVNDTYFEVTYRCQGCWSWDQDGAADARLPATTASAQQLIGWAQATSAPANPSEKDSSIQQHADSAANIFAVNVASARNTAYTDWITKTASSYPSATAAPSSTGAPFSNGTATATATATSGLTTATPTAVASCAANSSALSATYDYIIVGSGAGGIPLAAKLAASGDSVLLIERGPPSSGRWGGTLKPDWLVGTNLTRFDVPGLDNEIWADSQGIACSDYSVMAGCVLGGGTAVNAGLWWRANPKDFDENFPEGWKSSDLESSVNSVFERIPYTDVPSMDGVLYKPEGYYLLGGALVAAGWSNVTADKEPGLKNRTFSHPNHMFSNGERGGPLATYLVDADALPNFTLMTNTSVARVIRDSSQALGVDVEATGPGGQCGSISLTPTGKVILSAGAFGTPKILFRSGIGPQDQLTIVQKAEGTKMINSSQWLNLPVGYSLDDHTGTDVTVTHPGISFYDFYGAYDNPIAADAKKYLDSRSGILAQSAPNLIAIFWEELTGADGITRQMQYQARVESSGGVKSNNSITITQYLGRGKVSKGRTTITSALNMVVSQTPYVNDDNDLAAIKAGLTDLFANLAVNSDFIVAYPAKNTSIDAFLAGLPLTTGARSGNHWMGSAKMGLDSGLENGTAVVDTNTKVYGMDNLFVVDASMFPGITSTNPSALIVAAAVHAAGKIAAIDTLITTKPSSSNNTVVVPPFANSTSSVIVSPVGTGSAVAPVGTAPIGTAFSSTVAPVTAAPSSSGSCTNTITVTRSASSSLAAPVVSDVATSYTNSTTIAFPTVNTSGIALPTGTAAPTETAAPSIPATTSAAVPTTSAAAPGGAGVAIYQKCGGIGWTGATECASGLTCKLWNPYYAQCVTT
ncbi:hypothetical protein B0A48_00917 [Cryoendolithus antarcticus]|uniref:CBM1 domain-containing protein n=1 Tax=Cryoendolithus antarcticus TaxID=1507870 RepID=A0A1V8TRW3_9PEZI|nr:hypothetical protein B0A48_00917 [Cryoendolithus antarcticus]